MSKIQTIPVPEIPQRCDATWSAEQAWDLRVNYGLSWGKISTVLGAAKSSIHEKVRPLIPNDYIHIDLELIKEREADIVDRKAYKSLFFLTDGKLKEMGGRDLAVTYGILKDKARVIRGQATEIIDYYEMQEQSKTLDEQQQGVEERLAAMGHNVVVMEPETTGKGVSFSVSPGAVQHEDKK